MPCSDQLSYAALALSPKTEGALLETQRRIVKRVKRTERTAAANHLGIVQRESISTCKRQPSVQVRQT